MNSLQHSCTVLPSPFQDDKEEKVGEAANESKEEDKSTDDASASKLMPEFSLVHHLEMAGLGEGSKMLYMREASQALFDALTKNAATLLVEGPPGTGKSILTWYWASEIALKTDITVCWIHVVPTGVVKACMLGSNKVFRYRTISRLANAQLFIEGSDADVVIVDGMTEENRSQLMPVALNCRTLNPEISVVFVTSAQIRLPVQVLRQDRIEIHKVPSWTLAEYQAACENEKFFDEVKENLSEDENFDEKITGKYFYAGGSARWMFALNVTEVIEDAFSSLSKVTDMNLLLSGLQGSKSGTSVNHLLQQDLEGKTFIVSEYVLRQLVSKCETRFIREATSYSYQLHNPSFDGWIFELDFLFQLRLVEKGILTIRNGQQDEIWQVSRRIPFHKEDELKGKKIKEHGKPEVHENKMGLQPGDWLLPQRWNQGCYDAVQILPQSPNVPTNFHIGVRFVQVTRGESHSLKLRYPRALLLTLACIGFVVQSVDIVVLRPLGNPHVKITQPEGELLNWGWDPKLIRQLELRRSQ